MKLKFQKAVASLTSNPWLFQSESKSLVNKLRQQTFQSRRKNANFPCRPLIRIKNCFWYDNGVDSCVGTSRLRKEGMASNERQKSYQMGVRWLNVTLIWMINCRRCHIVLWDCAAIQRSIARDKHVYTFPLRQWLYAGNEAESLLISGMITFEPRPVAAVLHLHIKPKPHTERITSMSDQ